MKHISQLLQRRVLENGIAQNVEISIVIEEFSNILEQLIGEEKSQKIKPLYIKNKVLTLACLSSIVANELNFYKQDLINQLNSKFKRQVLANIKFVI